MDAYLLAGAEMFQQVTEVLTSALIAAPQGQSSVRCLLLYNLIQVTRGYIAQVSETAGYNLR